MNGGAETSKLLLFTRVSVPRNRFILGNCMDEFCALLLISDMTRMWVSK